MCESRHLRYCLRSLLSSTSSRALSRAATAIYSVFTSSSSAFIVRLLLIPCSSYRFCSPATEIHSLHITLSCPHLGSKKGAIGTTDDGRPTARNANSLRTFANLCVL